jgi:hypothetical protein
MDNQVWSLRIHVPSLRYLSADIVNNWGLKTPISNINHYCIELYNNDNDCPDKLWSFIFNYSNKIERPVIKYTIPNNLPILKNRSTSMTYERFKSIIYFCCTNKLSNCFESLCKHNPYHVLNSLFNIKYYCNTSKIYDTIIEFLIPWCITHNIGFKNNNFSIFIIYSAVVFGDINTFLNYLDWNDNLTQTDIFQFTTRLIIKTESEITTRYNWLNGEECDIFYSIIYLAIKYDQPKIISILLPKIKAEHKENRVFYKAIIFNAPKILLLLIHEMLIPDLDKIRILSIECNYLIFHILLKNLKFSDKVLIDLLSVFVKLRDVEKVEILLKNGVKLTSEIKRNAKSIIDDLKYISRLEKQSEIIGHDNNFINAIRIFDIFNNY